MALQLVITNAGRAAIVDQAKGGFHAVRIAAVGVSPTAVTAAPAATALADEVKRITTIAGEATATDVTHLTVTDESSDSYTVRSFALYLGDGTLFALYGQADPIVQKSAQALLLLAIDVALSDVPAAAITFGNANFINPAATTERAGVVALATEAEAAALADATRALTPKAMTAIFTAANVLSRLLAVDGAGSGLDADLLDGRHAAEFALLTGATFSGNVGIAPTGAGQVHLAHSGTTTASGYVEFRRSDGTREGYIGFAPTGGQIKLTSENGAGFNVTGGPMTHGGATVWDAANDGSGSGLDADLLDGRHAAEFALLSGAGFSGAVTVGTSATGRVALASSGSSANTGYVEFTRATGIREGYIGFAPTGGQIQLTSENGAGFNVTGGSLTHGGATVWDAANDGSGSGLDADLLDGQHGTDFVGDRGLIAGTQLNTAKTPGFYRVSYPNFSDTMLVWRSASSTGAVQLAAGFDGRLEWRNCVDDTTWSTWRAIWHAGNDGAGSGLDADLLDGRHAAAFALLTGATFSGNVGIAPTGAGQVFLAHSGTTTASGYVEFRRSDGTREGYIGFAPTAGAIQLTSENGRGFNVAGGPLTRATNTVWDAGNDGAGSGLDADLLDGWQRDDVRDWNNLLNRPAAFPPAAHTHGAADIAAAFTGTLSDNGYTVLPNGLILQWVTGAQQAAGSETTQIVTFPIAFNACFHVMVTTQVANADPESHAVYQLISFTTENATVMRQLVNTAGADREPSWPRLFAIGR